MKRIFIIAGVVSLLSVAAVAAERSMLARVTVYWASGGSGSDQWTEKHQAATSVRLRKGHCAVDPRQIPYGSKVVLPDGTLTAVDTGGHVKSRLAARRTGRSAAQRNAIVVDRFFETKSQALTWAKKNPHFMTVRVFSPGDTKAASLVSETRTSTTTTTTKVAAARPAQSPPVAPKMITKRSVVTRTSTVTSVVTAKPIAPAPAQVGLRQSVATPRTPASPVAAAPQQPTVASASSQLNGSAAAPAKPIALSAPKPLLPTAAARTPGDRLALNSPPQVTAPTIAPSAVMVHGPSHYDRRVSYMP